VAELSTQNPKMDGSNPATQPLKEKVLPYGLDLALLANTGLN